MSRLHLKTAAHIGMLPGLKKASW
ncbi:MAG: hypothetical protein ACI7YS_16200 [Flavobacterium sp.]